MTEITLRGDVELLAKLNKLADKRHRKVAFRAMGTVLKGKMQKYPAQRFAGSSAGAGGYVRTRNLAKRWAATAKQDHVKVQNFATYAPYVQGDDTQFHFHRATGWQTLKATAVKHEKALVNELKKQVDRILEGR